MPVTFHILDVSARDEKIISTNENEQVVAYTSDHEGTDDEEIQHKNKYSGKKGQADHSNKSFIVHLFGKTSDGVSIRADVRGFKPFFFIRSPDGPTSVQERARNAIREYLKRHIAPTKIISTIEITKCNRKELFGFTKNQSVPMLKLTMPSLGLFREVKNCFCNGNWEPELKKYNGRQDYIGDVFGTSIPKVYEANLDPMLRFLHLRNLKPCNWATIDGIDVDQLEEDESNTLECDWEDIEPCNNPPAATAPFKILSWDIECMSNTGAFPMATKGDPIIQIGNIVTTLGASTPPEKHIFVLGTCDQIPEGVVHTYKDERKLLLGWFQWLEEQNIDIFIGYNIFGFDEKYVWERCDQLGITGHAEVQQLNRLHEEGSEMKLEEKRLSSSAMGDNFMFLWTTVGRLRVDLYHYIKRAYPLPSYKLDDTSRNFLGESVKSINELVDSWSLTIATTTKQDVAKGRSVVLLNANGDSLCEKLDVLDYQPGCLIVSIPDDVIPNEVAKWAVVKDDVSPKEMFKMHTQGPAERAIIARYCLQDSQLVLDLFKKLDVFNNAMSMANVCSVPVCYIFLRGQGVKIESLMFKYCYEREQSIVTLPSSRGNLESYEGAIVLDPTPGFYTTPVGVADFASLYPSTIISENISHDTLVWVKDYDENGNLIKLQRGSDEFDNLSDVRYTDIEYDVMIDDPEDMRKVKNKIKAGIRVCRYAQTTTGTIPQIVAGLLAARKAKRKEAEKVSDPFRKALLDSEQLAYKLTANSLYGQLGSSTFKVRLQELAASVTAYGRKQILFAKAAIEDRYGPNSGNPQCSASAQTVYGDSVASYTMMYNLRLNGHLLPPFSVEKIASLFNNQWIGCIDPGREEKESCETPGLETLTERGWTKVYRIIRHQLHSSKKMLRLKYAQRADVSQIASIDVTEDHSLLLQDSTTISPKDLQKGDGLLSNNNMKLFVVEQPTYILYDDYVYDLTTENHHFQAGELGLVVHNTDSLFIAFNPKNPLTGKPLEGQEALEKTIELTIEAGQYVTKALKAPHDFEFDKVYWPFIIFSKKRYVGHKYEDPKEYVLWFMGVALKRRDYAPIVKRIYSGALNILLQERDVPKAAKFVQQMAADLVDGKFGLQPLIISKSLRAEYADPSKIAHKALADRIAARDPGNAPASGDRIPFVYIQPPTGQVAPDLQGERIETPSYIREKGLKPDYMFYIDHQISNPICQLFGVVVDQIPGFEQYKPRGGWKYDDPNTLTVQRETAAYHLLFDDAIQRNNNSAKKAFAKLLGVSTTSSSTTKSTPAIKRAAPSDVNTQPVKRQSTLDSLFKDRMLLDAAKSLNTKKKSAKESAKEK